MTNGSAGPLPTRRIGARGPQLSVLGFGAAPVGNLGRPIDDDTALRAIDAAWDAGIRYFDTAPHYGLGLSERRLGAALSQRRREEYLLSTKVGRILVPNPAPTGSDLTAGGFAVPDDLMRARDYTRDGVLRSIESSLARLGTDRIDIVYVHDPEDHLGDAIGHGIPALVELRDQRVIRAVGAGMNFVAPLRRIVAQSDVDIVMVAGRYTLLDRTAEVLLEQCAQSSVAVAAAAPFNSGLLARPWPADDAHFDYAPAAATVLGRAREYAQRCEQFGVALPQAAIQFPLRHQAVTSVVTGMRTSGQVQDAVSWMRSAVPARLWSVLDELAGRQA